MVVTHLDHVTAIITSVTKARAFYGGILGLVEIAPPATFDFIAVWYRLQGGYLHLLLKDQPDSFSPRHFCLHIDNVDSARAYFRGLNIPFDETVAIPGCDRIFVRDPDGNRIELLHWESPYNPERDGRYAA